MLYNKAIGATASAQKIYIEDVFSTYLYTGNGSTQTITNGIDLSGKGGLVWIKSRAANRGNSLFDTARGASKLLCSNQTTSQDGDFGGVAQTDTLTSFNSNGFSLGADTAYAWVNSVSGSAYVSWTFRKAAKFFDVVTATTTSTTATITHNLGSVPGAIIRKRIDSTSDWFVWHRSLSSGNLLYLNLTLAQDASSGISNVTSTSFDISGPTGTYVFYIFAHDAGGFGDSGNDSIIKCGSFAHGSDTELENLGWEPQWVLVKSTSTGEWRLYDTLRGASTNSSQVLLANSAAAEVQNNVSSAACIVPRATGFNHVQFSFETFIYIAIRRGPMKTPTDATKVFDDLAYTQSSPIFQTTNFVTDSVWTSYRNTSGGFYFGDRLRGGTRLAPNSTAEEAGATNFSWDSNTSYKQSLNSGGSATVIDYAFRRAPGFFDVVAYTGTGSVRTVSHNLGVAPELMIVKIRNGTDNWAVYSATAGNTRVLRLNLDSARATLSTAWNNTTPTASVFTVGTDGSVNSNGSNYIAYLFATCPGVSKVGSYVGTGTTLQVDCGFTNGARFILIKRNESAGDWHVWDAARGIISGNDPFLLLNSQAAENTGTDYIDPLSTGFEISSTAPTAINASGGTFIYLAIA